MKDLLRFLSKYSFFLMFVGFQTLSLILLFNYNDYHHASFINSANSVTGFFYAKTAKIKDYINLKTINQQLADENYYLHNQILQYKNSSTLFTDTIFKNQYTVKTASVINNSVNKQYNYLTIKLGSDEGAIVEAGVFGPQGIVGIIKNVSPHYAAVISVLNPDLRISAMIAKNGYYGSLVWDGKDYRYGLLKEIPNHIDINKGDTIITSGYSAIFPKGIVIGFIEDLIESEGENFYTLRIRFSTDFKNLQHVYVITNKLKQEQKELELKSGYGERYY